MASRSPEIAGGAIVARRSTSAHSSPHQGVSERVSGLRLCNWRPSVRTSVAAGRMAHQMFWQLLNGV